MELKVSAEKPGFSSSDGTSDPEDQKISEGEDEDDDRNHKHRRREAHSQSMEGNSLAHGFERPYHKRNRAFQNEYSYRDSDSQAYFASERGIGSRVDKKRSNMGPLSGMPSDLGQRFRGNQPLHNKFVTDRSRGMEPLSWGVCDPRLGLADASSVSPALFAGTSMPNVTNTQGTSWASYGLIPGVPSGGGLDSLHPLNLQVALGPAFNPHMNLGIPRQRCRDFEERGFCLRGDMCPMEHGINRIVVDDFQSLSQFNLPASVPGPQLIGASPGHGRLPNLDTSLNSSMNTKTFNGKHGNPGTSSYCSGSNGGVLGASLPVASDVYDPDQPLLANDNPETSAALLGLNKPNMDETGSFTDADVSSGKNTDLSYTNFNNEHLVRSSTAPGSQSSSAWGRMNSLKHGLEMNEKTDSAPSYLRQDGKTEEAINTPLPDFPPQGLLTNIDGNGMDSSYKLGNAFVHNIRKPSQKALRTLFINGVPLKDNKRESLLSHFQKFGNVIDIYIPMNSERAFVQFSKREEAEMALKSPDAVMGNRFIKLWWANRDNIPDGKQGTSGVALSHGMMSNPSTSYPTGHNKGKETPNTPHGKDGDALGLVAQSPMKHHKPLIGNTSKTPPLQKKKLENLEILKEEIRKKQQMLDLKRNEFKRQLNRLEKMAVGSKNGAISDQSKNGFQSEMSVDPLKAEKLDLSVTENERIDKVASTEHTSYPAAPGQELLISLPPPLVNQGTPFAVNKFKLDNRPTAFRIVSPLPAGLLKIDALEDHFSVFGGLSSVELEGSILENANNVSARVSFTARQFAEKAFNQGKLWKDQKLHFIWLTSPSPKESGIIHSANPSPSSSISSLHSQPRNLNEEDTPTIQISEIGNQSPGQEETDSK